MAAQFNSPDSRPDPEGRLAAFGLSSADVHTAMRPGASRANNRTAHAPRSARGTDIYLDGMENLSQMLASAGWREVYVEGQLRLLHPDHLISFTIASATGVGQLTGPYLQPHTNRKGKSTRQSLHHVDDGTISLFEDDEDFVIESVLVEAALGADLWFLLHERTDRGLHLEFSRPAEMSSSGIVNGWAERIPLPFLELDGDLSVFDQPDDGDGDVDVPVEPR
ncbi:hypothetical protein [Phycicoccus flavus]|uniref:hypothetical protein n=1 Tax=Phycicoccus flavus TaxID=2502783 RepID=UPI000FEB7595|nr:hypothetical protein [Phycicoccus flavus]NHA70071.1 hypothetical protein [Phycicoccus flavus]NHA70245.1 hypothetical protein [Phycicoccus flavus]